MRRARRILLLVLVLILAGVGGVYYARKKAQDEHVAPKPRALPQNLNATADRWCSSQTVGKRPVVDICAKSFQEVKDPPRMDLTEVELRLYRNEGLEYDQVRCSKASFSVGESRLYSEGDVEITRGVPAEGAPKGRLMMIRSSGVSFESKTGKATTERAASFDFDQGEGKCVGATYDPVTRELHMHSQVELTWRGRGPGAKPMKIEAGQLYYKEREAKVYMVGRARLTREAMALESERAVVTLEEGAIRLVEAPKARGSDHQPQRALEYEAQNLAMSFTPEGLMEKLRGDGQARVVSVSEDARTTVATDHVELDFDASGRNSVLQRAWAAGHSVVESEPLPRRGAPTPQARVLRSDTIELRMRAGGREIQEIATHAPGQLEFLAKRPAQRYRRMEGERMYITYGANNQIQSFRSVNVATLTEREPRPNRAAPPPARTWSKDLNAEFDPQTGEMVSMRQWQDFRYEEGARRARASEAWLDSRQNRISLRGGARVWDPTGSAAADRIDLDQATGDFTAEGNVSSTRLPDKKGASSAMLSSDQPLQGRADRMSSADSSLRILYEGHAVVWQGGNRLRADRIEIDRNDERLAARGSVLSEFLDKPRSGAGSKKKAFPLYTVVTAARLQYEEESRVAHYTGGVLFRRPGMEVKSAELRAHLNDSKSDSSLEKAFADGQVAILETAADRTRRGSGEHAEYYVKEEKVILSGGSPTLVDSLKGSTSGRRLTYFSGHDRLLVDGLEREPAKSRIRRKQ